MCFIQDIPYRERGYSGNVLFVMSYSQQHLKPEPDKVLRHFVDEMHRQLTDPQIVMRGDEKIAAQFQVSIVTADLDAMCPLIGGCYFTNDIFCRVCNAEKMEDSYEV